MNISVLGCGRWGSFHAWYANSIGHKVTLWGRTGSTNLDRLVQTGRNDYLTLSSDILLTDNLQQAVQTADICIVSINAQQFRSLAKRLKKETDLSEKPLVLCMKGLEIGTGKRLSEVASEELGSHAPVAVWVGPGHVQDFVRHMPNCMVISSTRQKLTENLVQTLTGPLIRFYYGRDLLGTEIGAAAKNVMGIAAGMLDGLNYTSLKGALMARGTRELSRLIAAMGGQAMTVYGLSHLGDYEATLFSSYSNNRRFGEEWIKGKQTSYLAEGYYTSEALMNLSEQYKVELPISRTVYEITHKGIDPKAGLESLFLRSLKDE